MAGIAEYLFLVVNQPLQSNCLYIEAFLNVIMIYEPLAKDIWDQLNDWELLVWFQVALVLDIYYNKLIRVALEKGAYLQQGLYEKRTFENPMCVNKDLFLNTESKVHVSDAHVQLFLYRNLLALGIGMQVLHFFQSVCIWVMAARNS